MKNRAQATPTVLQPGVPRELTAKSGVWRAGRPRITCCNRSEPEQSPERLGKWCNSQGSSPNRLHGRNSERALTVVQVADPGGARFSRVKRGSEGWSGE